MQPTFRASALAALVITMPLFAQTARLAGHWDGAIEVQGEKQEFSIDVTEGSQGAIDATFSMQKQNLKALPMQKIAVDGAKVAFRVRSDQPFTGVLSPDGKSLSGNVSAEGYTLPFTMTRTGEARVDAPPKMPAVGDEFAGRWEATPVVGGATMRVVLEIANGPRGARAAIVNLNEGGLRVPASGITQTGRSLTLDFAAVGASYSGVLNEGASQMTGSYHQGALTLPVTFHHVKNL